MALVPSQDFGFALIKINAGSADHLRKQSTILNFRHSIYDKIPSRNFEAVVAPPKKEGVTIADQIKLFEYGKFVRIIDVGGNYVGLWSQQMKKDSSFYQGCFASIENLGISNPINLYQKKFWNIILMQF